MNGYRDFAAFLRPRNQSTKVAQNKMDSDQEVSSSSGDDTAINKKKRTAFENISTNASGAAFKEEAKKQRYDKLSSVGVAQGATKVTKDEKQQPMKPMSGKATGVTTGITRTASKENLVEVAKKAFAAKARAKIQETKQKPKMPASVSVESCSKLLDDRLELNSASSHVSTCASSSETELAAEDVQGWKDIDADDENDVLSSCDYVNQIFKYYKQREAKFQVKDYLQLQTSITSSMRFILVDWMVEVQQQLEFNHEVLYLAVRLVDLYLSQRKIDKRQLQLIGATSMFIACKFEERLPPVIDDFVFISDNAFSRDDLIRMEIDLLKVLKFDVGAPLSYTFLRRYSKCVNADMKFLTLARYILELSLQDFYFSTQSESHKACAALYLAMKMTCEHDKVLNLTSNNNRRTNQFKNWSATLVHYTGYFVKDFKHLLPHMNALLRQIQQDKHKTIHKKYSHQVFYEVAKTTQLSDADLNTIVDQDIRQKINF